MIEPEELRRWERQIATMLRQAATDDPETFAAVAQLLTVAATDGLVWSAAGLTSAQADGKAVFSWEDIGRALGVTKQSAWRKFSHYRDGARFDVLDRFTTRMGSLNARRTS